MSIAFYIKIHTFSCFKSNSTFFAEPMYFSTAKVLNVLRDLTRSVALYRKIENSGHLWKFLCYFRKTHLFCKKTQFLKVLRNLTVSVSFDIKLTNFSCFQKFRFLFRKNHLFFLDPNIREISLNQSILRQVCYLCHFKRLQFFSKNRSFL